MSAHTPERRISERRISPAIGEHAILECARLKQINAELLAALVMIEYNALEMNRALGGDGTMWKVCADAARAAILKAQP